MITLGPRRKLGDLIVRQWYLVVILLILYRYDLGKLTRFDKDDIDPIEPAAIESLPASLIP